MNCRADSGAIGPDCPADGVDDLDQEPGSVLGRAHIGVVASVCSVAQECVDEVGVGGMDFDAVETGRDRPLGGAGNIGDGAVNVIQSHRSGNGEGTPNAVLATMPACCRDLGGRQRPCAVRILRHHRPAHMPKLDEEAPARGVHRSRTVDVRASGSFSANSGDALVNTARDAMGSILAPEWLVGPFLANGELVEFMLKHPPVPDRTPLYAVHPYQCLVPPKVKTYVDFLVNRYGKGYDWARDKGNQGRGGTTLWRWR